MKIKKHLVIIALLIILLILSILLFKNFYKDNYKPYVTFDSKVEKMKSTKVADAKAIGWLRVQGTNIDYPIINETYDAYYSGIDYLWKANRYVPGENRVAIYGHNILNISSEPLITDPTHVRFEQLLSFVYYDFAKDNLYIQYTHNGEDEIYKIYAVGFVSKNDEYGNSYTGEDLKNYIKTAKDNSIYDYDIDVDSDDDIISLITCTRYFGLDGLSQFRIDARKVRKNEKIVKYDVEINDNYSKIKDKEDTKDEQENK